MVTKLQKKNVSKKSGAPMTGSVKDSAQQIWQAGLGAFNKAQAEGSKAFEALVKEGVSLQRKTQSAAEEKLADATHKMSSMATDLSSRASGQWDKLENIFEERVAKVLNKLGVPSAMDVDALIARIEALNQSVQKLAVKVAASKNGAKVVPRPAQKAAPQVAAKKVTKVASKPAVKRAAASKTATAVSPD